MLGMKRKTDMVLSPSETPISPSWDEVITKLKEEEFLPTMTTLDKAKEDVQRWIDALHTQELRLNDEIAKSAAELSRVQRVLRGAKAMMKEMEDE